MTHPSLILSLYLSYAERTPLHSTALIGRGDIAYMLLNAGANIAALDIHGWSAKQIAELHQYESFLNILTEYTNQQVNHNVYSSNMNMSEAEWSSRLWTEVVRGRQQHKKEFAMEKNKWEQTVQEANLARQRLIEKARIGDDLAERASSLMMPSALTIDSASRMQNTAEYIRGNPSNRLGKMRRQRAPKLSAIDRNNQSSLATIGDVGANMAKRLQPLSGNSIVSYVSSYSSTES